MALSFVRFAVGWPGPSGFGSRSTAEEVAKAFSDRPSGRVAIVTGANSGIGFETAKNLAKYDATVILACRSLSNASQAADSIKSEVPEAKVIPLELDLASLESVHGFVAKFKSLDIHKEGKPKLHLLINNAGVMACPKTLTKDNFELQFGTNHLGHFLLTNLLGDALKQGAAEDRWARVVIVSSIGHLMAWGGIPFDDLNGEKYYEKWYQYAVSKLANILHAVELNSRFSGTGVTAYAVHPGVIATNLSRHQWAILISLQNTLGRILLHKSIPQGAATTMYCALAPNIDTPSTGAGQLWMDCNVENTYRSKASYDLQAAKRLWEISEQLTNSKLL